MRALIVMIVLALSLITGCDRGDQTKSTNTGADTLGDALGGDAAPGFERATGEREFRFPYDHGPHPDYRNEWWYVTGNLDGPDGRRLGFQFTLFRIGLAPGEGDRASRWATNQGWMAHFAVTDAANDEFHAFERFSRGGDIGLAGAERDPVRVWLEDWQLAQESDGTWRLQAAADDVSVDLTFDPRKRPVLQGDDGLSHKSDAPGNASWYYSYTRMATEGEVALSAETLPVTGSAWMDREWSTSALGPDQEGWDWFALQLHDGTDIMLYRLREKDGSTDPWSAGTVVAPDGQVTRMDHNDFELEVLDRWESPRGGIYPARWRLDVAPLDRTLTVIPILADQELDLTVRYWEGAVDVTSDGAAIGRGYVELSGYGDTSGR
ncbi:lipocalin-like domain-containing protein [Halofilum ochraceum]|uniref:lipocalin-like domain-containing protein n=1 Tax=Halofilum ochraceum TaxID=1611323 RepID=UPI0008307DD5|nr:lipocalin-like domain-containing protein [Halofilum ochraceum]